MNTSDSRYLSHGGRGIHVCPEWIASFEAFLEHIGPRTSNDHSLDRIDNDGHYEPGNVRWATDMEQARNRRTSRFLTHDGRTMTIAAWSRETGIPYQTLLQRVHRGWPAHRAIASS